MTSQKETASQKNQKAKNSTSQEIIRYKKFLHSKAKVILNITLNNI